MWIAIIIFTIVTVFFGAMEALAEVPVLKDKERDE